MKNPEILNVHTVVNPVNGEECYVKINENVYLGVIRKIKKRWSLATKIDEDQKLLTAIEKESGISMDDISGKLKSLRDKVDNISPDDENYNQKVESINKEYARIEKSVPKEIEECVSRISSNIELMQKIGDEICCMCIVSCDKNGLKSLPKGYDSNDDFVMDLVQSEETVEEIIAFFLRYAPKSTRSPRLLGLT